MSNPYDFSDIADTSAPIPDGTYNVVVEKAEISPTKTGGEIVKIQFKILDGIQAGRIIFNQYNTVNANPKASEIGRQQLMSMMRAFGKANPKSLDPTRVNTELSGLKGSLKTKVEDNHGYEPRAGVVNHSYKPLSNAVQAPGAPFAPAAQGSNPF